jgi:hypothetical protein
LNYFLFDSYDCIEFWFVCVIVVVLFEFELKIEVHELQMELDASLINEYVQSSGVHVDGSVAPTWSGVVGKKTVPVVGGVSFIGSGSSSSEIGRVGVVGRSPGGVSCDVGGPRQLFGRVYSVGGRSTGVNVKVVVDDL